MRTHIDFDFFGTSCENLQKTIISSIKYVAISLIAVNENEIIVIV